MKTNGFFHNYYYTRQKIFKKERGRERQKDRAMNNFFCLEVFEERMPRT